jgi:hypothetical protein
MWTGAADLQACQLWKDGRRSMKSLFLFAAATAAVLASATFAAPGKLPNVRAGQALSGPEWERTAIYLDHVGQISCLGRTADKG